MGIDNLIKNIQSDPDQIEFSDVIKMIDDTYSYTPTRFSNGETMNEAGTNEGSCKIFAFGQLNGLSEKQTLACFGTYYRDDVLKHPDKDDHANIRNFMKQGWQGVKFEGQALSPKNS